MGATDSKPSKSGRQGQASSFARGPNGPNGPTQFGSAVPMSMPRYNKPAASASGSAVSSRPPLPTPQPQATPAIPATASSSSSEPEAPSAAHAAAAHHSFPVTSHPPFGFPHGFFTYEVQKALSNGAIYGGQPSADEAPVKLLPDGTHELLGYPAHCGLLQAVPKCYPDIEIPKSQYPYGALAFHVSQEHLADGNATAIKDIGAYLPPSVVEPVAEIPGMHSRSGMYFAGPRGGFGGIGACGTGCPGLGVMM